MLSLADAILQKDMNSVRQALRYGEDINALDEYGFRPLIEAAIIDNVAISQFLLEQGANVNLPDVLGGTALQWAVENNNHEFCSLLLTHGANPNAYNFSGQPVLVMAMLRRQSSLTQLLIKAGADQLFAQDYINTKLLGHMFELVGTVEIVDPNNQFVDVDFEGFYLEVTLGLIADSLAHFQNHFAARQLRRYSGISQLIVEALTRAAQLIKFQQYRVDITQHMQTIDALIHQEPLIIPVGYEGHAITFIRYRDIWVKCDRREDSRMYDNVMFYRVTQPQNLTPHFIKNLIFKKQSDQFINEELDVILGLEAITELKVEAQVSGNCSWANVEATIPAIFLLVLMQHSNDMSALSYYKTLALNYFHRWRDWNKDRALNYCIQSFERGDAIRKATKAEILAAVLYQTAHINNQNDRARIETILEVLLKSPYEYLIKNYVKVYYFESPTDEGKRFYELLKDYGYVN